ncbi:hypothetical protein COCON_G00163880 [Conger conger]|uniref:Nuclear pore complex protein Nup214 n=1 Tax=Conger conger TaxID=82655 RepID=A0A9Q1D6M6_CONCO|nr:hypothetical protein COCON_G00163880 [Conger conger]
MSDDPDAIPEREMKDFQFRQMKKVRVFDSPDDLPKERSSLLAISNKFGLTFVGLDTTLRVLLTRDIIAANKVEGPNDEIVEGVKSLSVSVDLPIHYLALSSDDLTLSVCGASNEERPLLAFFDIRTFLNKARQEKGPFASLRLAVAPGTAVQDLKWNPLQASVLAACLSDGSMLVLEVTDTATVQAQLPASAGITCVCWSPKGKQVAAGKQNATVIQYTPALQEKKVIPCPPFYSSDNPVKVLDVLWLSTYSFAVVYAAADGSPETPPELVAVSLPKKDEKRPELYLNFNDPVYGSSTERQHHYFLCHIEDWDLVLAASAASIEVSIIAKQEDKTNWELWLLEDASRAELPVTLNSDDTLPLGVAVDYTNQEEIHISDEKTLPPAPTLMLLSTDGVLCPFSLLNTNPGVKQLVAAPLSLPLEGERLPSAGSVAAPPPAAAVGVAIRPPPTSTPTPAPAALTTPMGFSFSTPALQPAASSGFSLGSSGVPPGLSLGSAGFSFASALAAKPSTEPSPAASAFSFSTPSVKPPVESVPAPAPSPAPAPAPPLPLPLPPPRPAPAPTPAPAPGLQRLATASPVTVFKLPAEPATPAVKVNLSDRFSAAETPVAPALQQFSFASASTSTPKPAFLAPSSQSTPLPSSSKPASIPAQTAQSSPAPAAVRTATPIQGPASSPAPQAALSIKALEKHLRKDADPIMAGILEEIAHFQKELDDLKARSDKADFRVGTGEEMQGLRKESDDLHVFALEIKETTESLHGDISSLKTTLLEGFAGAEDAKSQSELNRDREYLQLLYKKPLDPRSEDQLKEIRRLYQYVKFAVEDVNDVLDVEWEKHLEKKKKQRHLIVPEREALFTTLSNHLDIIHQQEHKLEVLVKALGSLRLYGATSSWATPRRPSPTPVQQGLDSELETLRDALLKASLEATIQIPAKSPAKMSPSKQAQLRNFLSKRQTPPVRSTAPANLSRSAFLSPKYYEDLDDVSSASSLSPPLDPEAPPLVEEEEPAPLPTPALPRHPAVVRTPSVQPAGFGPPSSLFSKVGSALGPALTSVLGGKISVSGADSTAFATKTVKHGAPPSERAPPISVPAQQAAANAALRRQMANQKPAVSASLTESTLKTVPQVVNVQELKERGSPIPVVAAISSSSPVPFNSALATNQAKRNSSQGVLKVSGPNGETSASPQPGFVFASSSPSLPEQTSKAFSFAAAAGGSFTFTSLSTASAAASQGAWPLKVKTLPSPVSSRLAVAVGERRMSAEPPKAAPLGGALRVEPQPRAGGGGETLGSFSGLRVGLGEEERSRPSSTGFGFVAPDPGPGLAEFCFGGGVFQQGRPAEPPPLAEEPPRACPLAAPEPPVSTVTETASDLAPAPQPGSIFTQLEAVPAATVPAATAVPTATVPTVTAVPAATVPTPTLSTDSATLGPATLTTAITTVASDSALIQESAPSPAPADVTTPTVFGQPGPPSTTAPPPAPGFGPAGFGAAPGGGGFPKPAFGQPSGFGQPAAAGTGGFSFAQSTFGAGPGFGQPAGAPPASSSGGGGGLFGAPSTSTAGSFSFGHMTTSGGSPAPSPQTGLFGAAPAPAFGQQGSVFGSNTTTTSSSGFSFNQPAAFGSTSTPSVFGQQGTPGTVFGQQAGSANKNPFGSTGAGGGFGQANQAGSTSLFGNSGAKTFGFGTTSSFGEPKPSGTFSTGGGSVAAQGFGSFTSPAKTGGFGSAPVFGSPPAFGGSPSFGGASAFGAAPSFSSPLAPTSGKVFGEGTAAANVGGFGFASAPNAPSFGGLASQSTPSFGSLANQNPQSFGSLAQQGSGFGGQSQAFSGFGSSGAFSGGGFGTTNQQNPRWTGLP